MNSNTEAQQHFRSNRKDARIHADLPCKVGSPGGKLSAAQVLDMSTGGLKFSCSQEVVTNIIPNEERNVGLIMDVEVDIQIMLPSEKKRAISIKTGARIIHTERLAQDIFHVGVQFKSLDANASKQLEAYIAESNSQHT